MKASATKSKSSDRQTSSSKARNTSATNDKDSPSVQEELDRKPSKNDSDGKFGDRTDQAIDNFQDPPSGSSSASDRAK